MAADLGGMTAKIADSVRPSFEALGLKLDQFVVESISLPDDLQKVIDQKIGVSMAGDLGRLTQFETAESLEEAAQNTGGGTAGMGVGFGCGPGSAQAMMGQSLPGQERPGAAAPGGSANASGTGPGMKFCIE